MKLSYLEVLLKETRDCVGFPVACLSFNSKGKILSIISNSIGSGKTNHHTHAEWKTFSDDKMKNISGKITLLITYPPCSLCLNDLNELGMDIEIIYLFDIWGKRYRQYIKIQNIKIKSLNVSSKHIDEIWKIIVNKYNSPGHKGSKKRLIKLHNSQQMQRMSPKKK